MRSIKHYLGFSDEKEILEERNRMYIDYVCAQTGWDREEAVHQMEGFRAQGVSYRYYVKKRLWAREGRKQEISLRNIEKEKKGNRHSLSKHAKLTAAKTGWSARKAKECILESNLYTGCSPSDYWDYRFYEKTLEEQKQYLTKGVTELLIMKYNTDLEEIGMIRSKDKFAKKFGDLFGRISFANRKITYEEFCEKTAGLTQLIVKPVYGTHGSGVEKLDIPSDDREKRSSFEMLMEKPKSQVEEVIVQHPDVAAFSPASVNTVRLVTIKDDSGIVHFMYAALRMGTGGLIDGISAGGIFAPVDVETGQVIRDGIKFNNETCEKHPVSGKKIKGFQVPNWESVLSAAKTGAERLKGARLIGWDIAVTQEGAVLIEANSEANYKLAQLPYVAEGLGVRERFEPFL